MILNGFGVNTARGKVEVAPLPDGLGFHVRISSQRPLLENLPIVVSGVCEDDPTRTFFTFSLSQEGAGALAWLLRDALDRQAELLESNKKE